MTQIQLSDTQAVILSTACARDNGLVFPVTANLKGGAVGNVLKSLLKRGLLEEIPANDRNTVWRHDEEAGAITLRATSLAYAALGIAEEEATSDTEPSAEAAPRRASRNGTKQALLIEMLRRAEGATIAQITEAMGWRSHTVRGAFAGALKKRLGLNVTSEKVDGDRVYRLPPA